MQSGPQNLEQTQTSKNVTKVAGAASATLIEMTLFHPFDTLVKNALHSPASQQALFAFLKSQSLQGKVQRLYQGFSPALLKKGPQRGQKWLMQGALNEQIQVKHAPFFRRFFGDNAKIAMATTAGALTGLAEPILVHPFDTIQILKQNQAKTDTRARALGLRGLYRGALFTGFARNAPGAGTLFGASEALNQSLGNKDKSNHALNFAAKLMGALLSSVVSQPGDVIKTKMQTDQVSLSQALAKTTWKQMLTNGIGPRVVFASTKVAFGFFMYERMVSVLDKLSNSRPPQAEADNKPAISKQDLVQMHALEKELAQLSIQTSESSPETTAWTPNKNRGISKTDSGNLSFEKEEDNCQSKNRFLKK